MSVRLAYTTAMTHPNAKRTITKKVSVKTYTNDEGKVIRAVRVTKRVVNNGV